MDKIFLYFSYCIFSLVTIELACMLIGIYNKEKRIFLISIIGGTADFIVMELIEPKYGFNNLHFVTGMIILVICFCLILKLRLSTAVFISILSYILSVITEGVSFLLIVIIWGKDVFISMSKSSNMITILGLLSLIPILIPTLYLKMRKKTLILKAD